MPDAKYVSAGKPKINGAIYWAPIGTTVPASITATLTGFTELGYASDAGVVESNTKETIAIKEWGGQTVLIVNSGSTDTIKFTLIEAANVDVLKVRYGSSNVSGSLASGITVNVNDKELTEGVWVVDMVLNDAAQRIVVPHGVISAVEDVTYAANSAIGYGITVTGLLDSSGQAMYKYVKSSATSSN